MSSTNPYLRADEPLVDPFKYRAPKPEQVPHFEAVADALASAYNVLLTDVPRCAERTLAIRHLQYARMMANAAIAFDGQAIQT
jgi:hypothetical protein